MGGTQKVRQLVLVFGSKQLLKATHFAEIKKKYPRANNIVLASKLPEKLPEIEVFSDTLAIGHLL